MPGLIAAIVLTLGISFCVLLPSFEAVVAPQHHGSGRDREALKKSRPARGRLFETIKTELDETIFRDQISSP